MHTSVGVWVELGFILFTFFVIAPAIAAAIGYAAWKGKPKSYDRDMYSVSRASKGVTIHIAKSTALFYAHRRAR